MAEGVELQVTNLDPGIEQREVRQLVTALFNEYVTLSGVNIYRQDGGGLGAIVKVGNMHEAQLAISQLHKRKVGTKRIAISHLPMDLEQLPKMEVVTLLQSVPGGKIQLFKFRQMYEERFRGSISVADLHRMKEVVTLSEDHTGKGRMVQLSPDAELGSVEVDELYCALHFPKNNHSGWGERKVWEGLPEVQVRIDQLSVNLKKLLDSHGGSLPLASLVHCYRVEFGELNELGMDNVDHGVPLEHLIQAVKGVLVVTGATGIKKIVEATEENVRIIKPSDLVGPPPALASQLITFTREVVDMLKTLPGCKIAFYKFIPRYHHHFGKQCRVADYGYTKLKELLESLPHVIQIIGEGSKTMITLAHKAQVRRFTNDLLKMLKNQTEKQFLMSSFSFVFERTFFKPLTISDYGVCYLTDILNDIPENTITMVDVTDGASSDVLISVFRRDQTHEEVMRTRGFAKEVVELLRHSPDLCICFNKFIPAYHQHFGRQCRVGSYGMSKLIELFEAIPDTVDIKEDGEERLVQLTKDKMIWVVGEQVESVVKTSRARSVALVKLEEEFQKVFGHQIPLNKMEVENIEELVELLQSWVRIIDGKEGKVVIPVDRGFIRTMANNVRKLLVDQVDGQMDLAEFIEEVATRFGSHIEVELLTRDLSYLVEVIDGKVCLTALQLCARDIEVVLGDHGQLPVAELDSQYEAKFGRELPLEPLGFNSVSEMLVAMNDTLTVKGRGIRKIVRVNKASGPSLLSPSRPSSILLPPTGTHLKSSEVASFSGRGFDMLRMVTPPHTVPRSYSGVVQSDPHHRSLNIGMPLGSHKYTVPPPTYRPSHPPPMVTSPPHNYSLLSNSHIPIAAPNSPATPPTTPRNVGYPYPMFAFYSASKGLFESPRSPIPTATFQQHMMQHSPSPLITQTQAPYIVQPISRTSPQVGFYPQQAEDISASLSSGLNIASRQGSFADNDAHYMNWVHKD